MAAESNVQNAIDVYRVAAAYHHTAPVDSIKQPSREDIEEAGPGVYRIMAREVPGASDRYTGPLAICSYDEGTDRWTVELQLEEKTSTVVWAEEDGQYRVVE